MKKILFTVVFTLLAIGWAWAALIPHYRMDSFALLSDAIVYCGEKNIEFREIQHPEWTEVKTLVRCEVLESYKGDIKKGSTQAIEFDSVFRRHEILKGGYTSLDAKGNIVRKVPPEYLPAGKSLVFLKKVSNGFQPITAKLVQGDRVFQFCQCESNPGGLVLAEQKPENLTLKPGEKYGERELLEDFSIALKKSSLLKYPVPVSPRE